MDAIATTAARVGKRDNPVLQIYPDLVQRMRLAPRFLLDPSVMRASVELSLGRPTVFREAMRHLRVPSSCMWVEWEESSRERLRQELEQEPYDPMKPIPDRLGFLIEADPGGRSGVVTWGWNTKTVPLDIPNIAPYSAHFDLDASIPQAPERIEGLMRANHTALWRDNPVQLAAFLDIWRTSDHRLSDWGRKWVTGDSARVFLADVYGEYLEIWSILLLLTASRPTVSYRPVNRDKLNKARAKKREPLLLDHTQITMQLSPREIEGRRALPLGYTRKSPRIHMVSRYLARRGDKHWLVEPYLRGSEGTVTRHVRVTR